MSYILDTNIVSLAMSGNVEVLAGLAPGDRVVLDPQAAAKLR